MARQDFSRLFKPVLLVLGCTAAFLAACSGDLTESVDTKVCASGTRWIGDEEESPQMHPGRTCINCHASDEGPHFSIAGTVYGADDQADDCFGQSSATIVITDAKGQKITVTSNEAGNFYSKAAITLPITAKVTYNGKTKEMVTKADSGECNGCHTKDGANGAPGRILFELSFVSILVDAGRLHVVAWLFKGTANGDSSQKR